MTCPTHRLALDPDDRDWTFKVAREWKNMDGAVEYWHCPFCDCRDMTVMCKGRRISHPLNLTCVIILDEHDEKSQAQVQGVRREEVLSVSG
jgi:hypothetical protein